MPGNTHINDAQVAQIVALYKHKVLTSEIASTVGVKVRTAQLWIKKFKDGGEKVQPRVSTSTGRKAKLTDRDVRFLRISLERNPRISSKQLKEKNPKIFGHVSARTLRKYIKGRLGYRCLAAKRKPLLTRRHKRNRLSYARRMLKMMNLEKFKRILYSDEATFRVSSGPTGKVYRPRNSDPYNSKYVDSTTKHPDSLMFWGCFSFYGTGALVTLPKNVTMN